MAYLRNRVHALSLSSKLSALALVGLLSLVATMSQARADYVLASGDVVRIEVYNVPDLQKDVTIDVDGYVAFGPLGLVDAKGLTLAELASHVRTSLTEQEILTGAQVTVGLISARPVYVGGDVTAPGAYPYRSGLTVRQAIALAGGSASRASAVSRTSLNSPERACPCRSRSCVRLPASPGPRPPSPEHQAFPSWRRPPPPAAFRPPPATKSCGSRPMRSGPTSTRRPSRRRTFSATWT